jgi:hypothetical protein
LAIGEEGIKLDTTNNIPESCLSILGNRISKITDFENGVFGLINLKINYSIDSYGNIILSDNFLFGNIDSVDTDIDFNNSLDNGNDKFKARAQCIRIST